MKRRGREERGRGALYRVVISRRCFHRYRLTFTSSMVTVCLPIGERNIRIESYTTGTSLTNVFLRFQHRNSFPAGFPMLLFRRLGKTFGLVRFLPFFMYLRESEI